MIRRSLSWMILLVVPACAADVSGAWNFKVASPEGVHTAKLTVTQDGEKLTGAFSSQRGEHKVEGTVQGDRVEFTVRYTGGDQTMLIPFRGVVEGDKMSGEYKAEETTGKWTAEKAK